MPTLQIRTPMLDIAYEAHGPEGGEVVILLHGFPYDPRGYDEIAPVVAAVATGYWCHTCAAMARRALSTNR